MRLLIIKSLVVLCAICSVGCNTLKNSSSFDVTPKEKLQYPESQREDGHDEYFGYKVPAPYRWLEDDNSSETQEWVKAQNKLTEDYLSKIPFRSKIKKRFEDLWGYKKYTLPVREGDKYYYTKNDGLQEFNVMYLTDDLDEEGEVLFDPNLLSLDGSLSFTYHDFNKDATKLAFYLSRAGSDWKTCYIVDVKNKSLYKDRLDWIKFSDLSWYKDGFFYSRYPEPKKDEKLKQKNEYHALYYHKMGDDQSKDKLIFCDFDNPNRNVYGRVSEDERFLYVVQSASPSTCNLHMLDLTDPNAELKEIHKDFSYSFSHFHNIGDEVFLMTNLNADNNKIIKFNAKNPSEDLWIDVVPNNENDVIVSYKIIKDKIFVEKIHNATNIISVYTLDGKYIKDVELPGIGTIRSFEGHHKDRYAYYTFTSFSMPSTVYRLDTKTLKSKVYRKPDIKLNSDDFVTKQEWYTSKDGTKVPMFLTMKKGIKHDGTNPTVLRGYGGFNLAQYPKFNVAMIPFLEQGGIYAVANIRGGGEFGMKWYKGGVQMNKKNVFDDFIAGAEYLIDQKYTSSEKLAIEGRSNGGLLIGACLNRRPDLFKVAMPKVGVMDMLRYHKFTIGWAWAYDYGTSDDSKEMFEYLYSYSPLHNIKEIEYPATMVFTADHDDRVIPGHSFKFAAELQHKQQGNNPILVRVAKNSGHGDKSMSAWIEEITDQISFLLYHLGETYK